MIVVAAENLYFLGSKCGGGAKNIGCAIFVVIAQQNPFNEWWKVASVFRCIGIVSGVVSQVGEDDVSASIEQKEILLSVTVKIGLRELRIVEPPDERLLDFINGDEYGYIHPLKHGRLGKGVLER